VADFQLKVTAETQQAQRELKSLDKSANDATKARSLKIDVPNIGNIVGNFKDLGKDVKSAANDIKAFYGVARQLPGVGDSIKRYESAVKGTAKTVNTIAQNNTAGEILSNSFNKATGSVEKLVGNLAKVGFALFGIKEAVGILQQAFGGLFAQTIGREVKLRETILKTQTTLASTNKVFKNGREITDPYEKIVSLTGEVGKRIDSIRERSIALAGVTSGEVIEVFGMIASQIGQIGGGLKEAEDLAINFAAALGTFGIPLYQARQEIGSILRGDITTDSYLAKALGITNEDIAKAKTQAGGVVKFLEDRLAASVAGQRIAAQGFAGIVSNIKDLAELVGQRFGAQLLDPLLSGLAAVFENLFRIREQIFSIVDGAGAFVARFAAMGQLLRERAGLVSLGEIGLADNSGQKALNDVKDAFQEIQVLISGAVQRSVGVLAGAISALKPAAMTIADAFVRLGKSFIEIKVSTFEALVRIVANLATAASKVIETFASLFNIYSRLLDLPIIQYFAEFAAQFALLKRLGMDAVTTLILVGTTITRTVIPALGAVGVGIGVLLAAVGAVVVAAGKFALVVAGLATALSDLPTIAAGVAGALKKVGDEIGKSGQGAVQSGQTIDALSKGFKNLGEVAKIAGLNIIKSFGWVLLIQIAVTLAVDLFGRYQKAQEEAAKTKRAELALSRLSTVYRNVGDDADYATKAARDFEAALAGAEYSRTVEELEKVRKKLNDLRYESQAGFQTWGELFSFISSGEGALFEGANTKESARALAEQFRLTQYARKYEAEQNKKTAEENIRLEADKRINLEKEIGEIRRQQQDQLFQVQQQRAQKEVEIFRAAGELRIFQMEEANKKLIEGEEGASRSALEALNNYLSVRERGELEIESAKQSLVIEVANLERQIENYKLENAKTIAKIKTESAQYEERVAKNIETIKRNGAKAQTASGQNIETGFLVGSTGRSTGPHLDIRSPVGDSQAVIDEAYTIIKAWQQMGVAYIQLSNIGRNVKSVTGERELRAALADEQRAHARRSGGGAIDIAVPEGTLVPRRTGTPFEGGRGGIMATSLDTGNVFLHGHNDSVASRGAAPTPVNTKAPNFDDIGAPAVSKFAEALRGVASAMERLRRIQEKLTDAKTKAAFEEISKAVFQPVGLESYEDKLFELDGVMQSLAQGTYDAFNPERSQIAAEQAAKLLSSERELDQILESIRSRANLSEREKGDLVAQTIKRHQEFVNSLRKEEQIRQRLNAIQQGVDLAKQFAQETAQIARDNEVIRTRNRLIAEGASPQVIERELEKLRTAQQFKAVNDELSRALKTQIDLRDQLQQRIATATPKEKDELQRQLDAALAEIRRLQELIKQLQAEKDKRDNATDNKPPEAKDRRDLKDVLREWNDELKSLEEETAAFAETVQSELGTALSSAFFAIIEGTGSVQEAFSNMFQNIYKMFIKLVMDMIAKWALLAIFKAFGFSFLSEGGVFEPAANGASFANGIAKFARGGAFTNSVVYKPTLFAFRNGGSMGAGVMGEAGPEAIMPLRRGAGGELGIIAHGGESDAGTTNVVVNVDASGSKVQGDTPKANELGRAMSLAVQQELIKQKRPGGLLA